MPDTDTCVASYYILIQVPLVHFVLIGRTVLAKYVNPEVTKQGKRLERKIKQTWPAVEMSL